MTGSTESAPVEPSPAPEAKAETEIRLDPARPKTTVVQITQSNPAWEEY